MDVYPGILRHISIENGGNVVLYVPGSEQHSRQREDFRISFLPQGVLTGANDRRREFQETVVDIDIG